MIKRSSSKGKIIFIGAGPGDPELITLKAVKYLNAADVVLTDRLVSNEIIEFHVNELAEVIYVGKQCRNGYSTPQEKINHLMVEYAKKGKTVIRLKGGDVSIFSNILDELQTLVEYKISYEIIPGITAALGAAAYAGIPLTARNYSNAVRFLTSYRSDVLTDEYWKELALTTDTLVFYMSSETINNIVKKLTDNKISKDVSLAVIEQATTPMQNVHIVNIYEFDSELSARKFASPSLVIIGKVTDLHNEFGWLSNSGMSKEYFGNEEMNFKQEKIIRA